jgi:hypothetical protein
MYGVTKMGKYYSGENCPKTGTYGQYSDRTNDYAGSDHDRKVTKDKKFPPSVNNHHFKEK